MFDDLAEVVLGTCGAVFGIDAPEGTAFRAERSHDLRGLDSVVLDAAEIGAAASTGATSLTLRLPAGEPIAGAAPAGLAISLGGQDYLLSEDVRAAAGVLVASIAPPLAAAAAPGAPVSLAASAGVDLPGALRNDDLSRLSEALAAKAKFEVLAPQTLTPPGWSPRQGDTVFDPTTGATETVLAFSRPPGCWSLICGEG